MTGINQILEEAKVAKASLYQHYGSKEELGIEYIKKVREDWFSALESHLSGKKEPKQKILAAFDFLEINLTTNDFRGCRFLNLLSDVDTVSPQMREQIVAHKNKLKALFEKLVRQYTSNGLTLAMPNAHEVIYLLFEAAIVESKVHKSNWPLATAKKTIKAILTLPA